MELFAAGFNAWNQLSFNRIEAEPKDKAKSSEEPHDLPLFAKVLMGDRLERPVARLSYTIVRRDGRLCFAGLGSKASNDIEFLYSSAEAANGEILSIQNTSANGNALIKHQSLAAWKSRTKPSHTWRCHPPAKQIAAFDAGFAILYADGSLATLGDPRFENCLGRDITPETPADAPYPVPDLHDINANDPIKHITSGGFSVAALTRSGSVYIWGTSSTGTHRRQQAFVGLDGVPNYIEIDGEKDVRDVALGDSHAIALTTDGYVNVIGENNNGQLGLGREFGERAEDWTKVPFRVAAGYEIVGVAAGPKSSFILTSKVKGPGGSGVLVSIEAE